MKIITLTACSRTRELAQVLDALVPQLGDWELLIGIDGWNQDVFDIAVRHSPVRTHRRVFEEPLGIQNHQRELVREALEMGATAVCCLQDDTVPDPASIQWLDRLLPFGFLHHPSLGLITSEGKAVWRPWVDSPDRSGVVEIKSAFCAEGFVANADIMQELLPHWNGPTDFLDGNGQRFVGWDWSLASAARRLGLNARVPPTSLITNIGRTGSNANPIDFELVNGPERG